MPPVSGSSLGIVPLVAALCRVHGAEAAQGDHPDLLQPLEIRIVILLPSWVRHRIQKVDIEHGKILELISVMPGPVLTEPAILPHSSGHIRFVVCYSLLHVEGSQYNVEF